MTRTHNPDASNSFNERWLLISKLMFFCIGVIELCMGESIFHTGAEIHSISNSGTKRNMMACIAFAIGSVLYSGIADESKKYGSTLAVCIIGHVLIILGMKVCPLQTFIDQDTREMCFELLQIVRHFLMAGFHPIANAIALSSKGSFGSQRMFLPLGRLFMTLILLVSSDVNVRFGVLVFFSSVSLAAIFIFEIKVKSFDKSKEQMIDNDQPVSDDEPILVSPFRKLLTEPKFIVLCIGLLIAGINDIFIQASWKSQFLFVTGYRYRGNMKLGTTFVFCIAEALIYFFDDQIIQFLGKNLIMALGLILLIIRALCFAFMTPENIKMKLFILNFAQGFLSGLFGLAAVHCASDLVSGSTSAIAQSIFYIVPSGLATFLVNLYLNAINNFTLNNVKGSYIGISVLSSIILIPTMFLDKIFPKKSSQKTSTV